jgi:3-deoxy-D-manno-octulosonic-acid transferase
MIAALYAARESGQQTSLLLVPRHAERRHEVTTLLRTSGLKYHLRSAGPAAETVDVVLGDTTGELRKLTQLADVVFVGKSLPPHHEGQTPVEAAALGKPILFGPEMSNFREIARELKECGGARIVNDENELAAAVVDLLKNPVNGLRMADAARVWQQTNQGALARTVQIIRSDLGLAPSSIRWSADSQTPSSPASLPVVTATPFTSAKS